MPSDRRRLIWRALLVVAVLWAAWATWTALRVKAEAESARRDLREARAELDVESLLEGDALEVLADAADRFAAIEARLDNPLLAPARAAPVVGRQLRAASSQAGAAAEALEAVGDVGAEVVALAEEGLASGPARVDLLRRIAAVAGEGRAVFESLDLGPDRALLGPLRDARAELKEAWAEALDALRRAETAGAGLADLFEGPHDLLVLAANNAQMQNGQGMFLSAGVLHIEDGRMELGEMEPLDKVPPADPPVPLDPDLAARWGWLDPNHDFRHLGLSHRFPVTAALAAERWAGLGNPEVDGVLALDPFVVEAIMTATGPVVTSAGELSSDDVVRYALHDQYQGYLTSGGDRSYTEERRDALSEIAREVVNAFEQVAEVDSGLLERLRTTANGRHVLMWSRHPQLQAAFEAAGVDGQIGPESMLLSIVNRSGVKLDWFVRSAATLTVEPGEDRHRVTVEVTVRNEAPADGEPAYVVGPYPGTDLERGDYLGLVTLNLPRDAVDAAFDGVDRLAVAGADGHNRTIAAWVEVPRGEAVTLVARFELPAGLDAVRIEPSARAHPTEWIHDGRTWRDRAARTVELTG